MRVYLDESCVADCADGLAAALRSAADRAQDLGRIIIEIHADGQPLPTEALDDPDGHPAGIVELRLRSARPPDFLKVTLHEAADALTQAELAQIEAADLLERGDAKAGFDRLGLAFVLWDAARDVVAKSQQILGLDLDTLAPTDAPEQSVSAAVEQLRQQLDRAKAFIGSEDWASLSDLLRYDLTELAGGWRELLRHLAERIGQLSR